MSNFCSSCSCSLYCGVQKEFCKFVAKLQKCQSKKLQALACPYSLYFLAFFFIIFNKGVIHKACGSGEGSLKVHTPHITACIRLIMVHKGRESKLSKNLSTWFMDAQSTIFLTSALDVFSFT